MNLLLLPVVASVYCAILFSAPIVVGLGLLTHRETAPLGRRILAYSLTSLLAGIAGCWIGFMLMLMAWPSWGNYLLIQTRNVNLSLPVALFWMSGLVGVVLGPFLARRLLAIYG